MIRLGYLHLLTRGKHDDKGAVTAEVSNLQNLTCKNILSNAIGALFTDIYFFRPYRNAHFLPKVARRRMVNMNNPFGGLDLARAQGLARQTTIKQISLTNKVRHKTTVGILIDLLRCTRLKHVAVAHHGDARGHRHGLLLVMRDHDACHFYRFNDVDELKLCLFS